MFQVSSFMFQEVPEGYMFQVSCFKFQEVSEGFMFQVLCFKFQEVSGFRGEGVILHFLRVCCRWRPGMLLPLTPSERPDLLLRTQ